jgi:hypothetical protein
MWSTQPSACVQAELVGRLRAIVPAPTRESQSISVDLDGTALPEQVAELLRTREGFVWLDGEQDEHRLFAEPIAQLSVKDGQASITISGRRITFAARAFDLFSAAMEAWGGPAAGFLVGTE